MKQVLLYLPALHAGYEDFLSRHGDADEILLLGRGFQQAYPSLAKDIRALPPRRAADYLRLVVPRATNRVIEPPDLPGVLAGVDLAGGQRESRARTAAPCRDRGAAISERFVGV